jgi:NitT/TauT family transport system ATP-binding protein
MLYKNINKKNLRIEESQKIDLESERLLKEYCLWEFRNNKPSSLSGGMRQRVALIRTLLSFPDLILLDEAFSALDYQTKLKVSEDIYNIIKKEGKTAIMVTHDIGEAISMGDKIIVLSNRPAHVKRFVEIKMDENGPINRRKSKAFQSYFDEIWDVIENE